MKNPTDVHQIWLQGGAPPSPLKEYTNQVRELCQQNGYIYRLWDFSDLEDLTEESQKLFLFLSPRCSDISQQSNVLRYLILQNCGGLYLDVDVRILRLPGSLEGAWVPTARNMHRIGSFALACPPGHPWIVRLVQMCSQSPLHVSHSAGSKLVADSLSPDVNRWPLEAWRDTKRQQAEYGCHRYAGTKMGHFKIPPILIPANRKSSLDMMIEGC